MKMKVWGMSENVPADGAVHEHSEANPETVPIYIRKVLTSREGNCQCGQTSNAWVCLPEQGDALISTHFNHADGSASMEQFDFSAPFVIAAGEHVELGVFGSGGAGNMNFGAIIYYTLEA